jgi:methylenetetrahydrofolate dehydrogenase (NADP+)/methenyltetrahydrofolate cyclohydrolase
VLTEGEFVFAVPSTGQITLGIFDKNGHLVRTLHALDGEEKFQVGLNGYISRWDGLDNSGKKVPPGTYHIRGYQIGEATVTGEAFHFNDWISESDTPPISWIEDFEVLEDSDLLLFAKTPAAPIVARASIKDGHLVIEKNPPADKTSPARQKLAELTARPPEDFLSIDSLGETLLATDSEGVWLSQNGSAPRKIELPATTTQDELIAVVRELNADPAIHGILVQSPPPKHIDEEAVIRAIDPRKDVDGFHPENVAKLALEDKTGFVPCTPAGCMRLLAAAGVKTAGAEAVVIGRSMIVGKPMALLLMAKGSDATVTVAHSRSRDLPAICRRADIVIAAVGRPEMVKADWVKDGAVVIDVGINRVEDPSKKSGYRLVGDVAYDEVAPKCAAITPVPGGVGPMTIALLMKNTLQAARQLG